MKEHDLPARLAYAGRRIILYGGLICLFASLTAALPIRAADETKRGAGGETGPALNFIESVEIGGEDIGNIKDVLSIQFIGDFLYVSAGKAGWVIYYKRDLQSGKLTRMGELEFGQRLKDAFPEFRRRFKWGFNTSRGCFLASAGNRLYVAPYDGGGMAWCDIDPRTGEPKEQGLVECPPSYATAVSSDQKNLYIKYQQGPDSNGAVPACLLAYRIDPAGKPVKAGEVTTPGIGWSAASSVRVMPNGKYAYVLTTANSIVCVECRENGDISYKNTFPTPKVVTHYELGSLDLSPDGQWLYVSAFWQEKSKFLIAKCNPDTGDITPRETIADGPKGKIQFLPDGSGGYWASSEGVIAFKRDPATGHLIETSRVKSTKPQNPVFAYDAINGFLYIAGDTLDVLKAEKSAAK